MSPRSNSRRRRGQAVVELAVAMLALLPLIFYALFLEEMLSYQLDWQEAIVTPAWDGLPYDYMRSTNVRAEVQHFNRLTYCDHSAAYDAFPGGACNDETHHQALTSHQCWMVPGGQQVTCTLEGGLGRDVDDRVYGSSGFNHGGLLHCTAKLGVMNYFLVNKIFNFEAEDALTDKGKYTYDGDVHGDAASGHAERQWVFGEKRPDAFGVLHDSWALTALADIIPTAGPPAAGNPLYDRVVRFYDDTGTQTSAVADARRFGELLAQDQLLNANASSADHPLGDDPRTPSLAYKAGDPSRSFPASPTAGGQNFASGWSDNRESSTYNSSDRFDAYFGVDPASW
jgi:hypothetical protein